MSETDELYGYSPHEFPLYMYLHQTLIRPHANEIRFLRVRDVHHRALTFWIFNHLYLLKFCGDGAENYPLSVVYMAM